MKTRWMLGAVLALLLAACGDNGNGVDAGNDAGVTADSGRADGG